MRYFKITIANSKKVWAIKAGEKDGVVMYWRVNKHGEQPEPRNLIIGTATEITERPAKMNLHYAELEIA